MASPSAPPPVKLICGMLSARRERLDEARERLAGRFGKIDIVSDIMDFDFTHYYDAEMGSPLLRQFVAFEKLVPPDCLADVKRATNEMEAAFARSEGILPSRIAGILPAAASSVSSSSSFSSAAALAGVRTGANRKEAAAGTAAPHTPTPRRPVNLDPGYVDSPKLVLASMKSFAHRVYLGGGVYGEVTLLHRRGRWTALEWTFPDYASGRYGPFLDLAWKRLREQLGEQAEGPA